MSDVAVPSNPNIMVKEAVKPEVSQAQKIALTCSAYILQKVLG